MPFGQMGFQGINQSGGFDPIGGSDVDWWDQVVAGAGQLGQNILAAINRPPVPMQEAGIGTVLAGAAGGLATEGIEALAAYMSSQGNGAMTSAAPGGLFRPATSSMKPRPVNKIQVMGPDGKCHTWLHATPKGWKVNATNVSGRRRHHHHPR